MLARVIDGGRRRLRKDETKELLARNACVYCKMDGHVVAFCPNAPPRQHTKTPDWPPGIHISRDEKVPGNVRLARTGYGSWPP